MSEEKKESKCNGCCCDNNKELNNEELDKVSGGSGWQNGKYVCGYPYKYGLRCTAAKTVDGISNVCTCNGKTNGKCHKEFKDNCTCGWWNKKTHECEQDSD